jgi:hypothetical protein
MRIKLMADYDCWPLWHSGGDEVGDIDPQSLPLTEELVSDLNGWKAKLDDALNRDDPGNTQWPDGFFVEFNREGRNLARRLKIELGSSYEVTETFWGE